MVARWRIIISVSTKQISARISQELSGQLETYCDERGLQKGQFIEKALRRHIAGEGERCVTVSAESADVLASFAKKHDLDEPPFVARIIRQHVGVDLDRLCLTVSSAVASAFKDSCVRQRLDPVGAADEAILQFVDSRGSQPHAFFFRLNGDAALRVSAFWEARGEPSRDRLVEEALLAYIDTVLEYDHGTRERYEKMLAEKQGNLN